MLQLGYTDRALGLIVRRLKEIGLYDRALLVVTADHGVSFRGDDQRRRATRTNLDDIAFMPLFVKLPRQKQGRVEDGYARTIDIFPTIARVLGIRMPWRVEGKPLVGRRLPPDGTITVVNDGGQTSGRLSALRRKRARSLERHAAIFGTSSFTSIYRLGPHRELLGRRVTGLTIRPSTAGARIEGRAFLDTVDPKAEFVPTFLAGTITGRHPTQLDLAVSLNGRIVAVTNTFAQNGKTQFSALFPESALRAGRNVVAVFAVRGSGRRLSLAQLRGGDLNLMLGGGDIVSTEGERIRIDPSAIAGTVQVATTAGGYAFKGLASTRKGRRLVDSLVVFTDGKAIFTGAASDLRPLRFLDKGSLDKSRFRFELPRTLLPGKGQDHSVRVFAIRGRAASELAYRGAYPWAHG
jgi:hypothetical protein